MKGKVAIYILVTILVIAVSFLCGFHRGMKSAKHPVEYRSDTVTVYKTRYVDSPIEKSSITVGRIAVPNYKFIAEAVHDTTETTIVIHKTDTLYIPREQKYYEELDGRARIWVSGYEPKLDRFEFDEATSTIISHPKPKRWNVSLSVGCGLTGTGPGYFVGVTGGWTLFQF